MLKNNLDTEKIIYHYTSLDALLNGIIVKEPVMFNEICMWATHSYFLNDKSEIKYSSELIDDKIKNYCNGKFYQSYIDIKELIDEKEIHILSFSNTIDSLPMWSMYGKQGEGIILGFDYDLIDLRSIKCNYIEQKDLNQFIDAIINKLPISENEDNETKIKQNEILAELYYQRFAIKSKCFEYEEEIRLIINPNTTLEQIFNESNPHLQLNFRINDNILIPYFKYYFQKASLVELWIGPTVNQTLSANSLRKYLDKYGFNHTKIRYSDCPLRT